MTLKFHAVGDIWEGERGELISKYLIFDIHAAEEIAGDDV